MQARMDVNSILAEQRLVVARDDGKHRFADAERIDVFSGEYRPQEPLLNDTFQSRKVLPRLFLQRRSPGLDSHLSFRKAKRRRLFLIHEEGQERQYCRTLGEGR